MGKILLLNRVRIFSCDSPPYCQGFFSILVLAKISWQGYQSRFLVSILERVLLIKSAM